jgi:hypothetical protein
VNVAVRRFARFKVGEMQTRADIKEDVAGGPSGA